MPINRPLARINFLTTTILSTSVLQAQASDTGHLTLAHPWKTNTEVMYYVREGAEHKAGIRSLIPIQQNNNSLSFLDVRLINGEGKVDEGNFALGQRWLHEENSVIAGWYGGLDVRRSSTGRRFKQLTLGGEILGETYDLIGNYYRPLSDPKFTGASSTGGVFVGNSLYSAGVFEEALEGYDVELGRKLNAGKWNRYEPRVYAKYYHFEGEKFSDKDQGLGLRFTARPRQDLLLELGWEEDKLRGSQVSFTFTYAFGQSDKTAARSLRQRMTEFHQRDIDIRETSQLSEEQRSSEAVEDRVLIASNVIHVDNSAATNGDGSFATPYNSIANCNAGDCNNANVIYVHAGDADYTTAITLSDGQRLIGQGYNLYGIGGDKAPAITTTLQTIDLAGNNEVAGLKLHSTSRDTIDGRLSTGRIYIHDNQISSDDRGAIYLTTQANTGHSTSVINIVNNQLDTQEREPVYIRSTISSGARLDQSITIRNNRMDSADRDGIGLSVTAEDQNSLLNRQINITDNRINSENDLGISISDTTASDGATINDQIVISRNQVSAYYSAISTGDNEANGNGSALNRQILISNNQVTSLNSSGISNRESEVTDGGRLTETITITDNIVTANDHGIDMRNIDAEDNGSELSRTVIISGNNLSGHEISGISLGEATLVNGALVSHTATVSGNTISSANNNAGGNNGIQYQAEVIDADSSLTNRISISNNTIDATSQGIYLDLYASNGSILSDFSISDNHLTTGDDGLYVLNHNNAGAANSENQFSADISNNRISADNMAIELVNTANDGSAIMQTDIDNNTLQADNHGVLLNSDTADQTTRLSDNRFNTGASAVSNTGDGSCNGQNCP